MTLWRRLLRPRPGKPAVDWLVVGLGNPGPRYAGTRHNAGRDAVAALASQCGIELAHVHHQARHGRGTRLGIQLGLAVPLTYMNDSGRAVAPLARYLRVPAERLLVVYDDLDLPLGVLRLRPEGGAGGHRGLTSIIAAMHTNAFPRLRLGIGRPPSGLDATEYVLSRFTSEERPVADAAIIRAIDALDLVLEQGLDQAMNRYN